MAENDPRIQAKIWYAQRITIISWLTYPVVYIIPMLGAKGASAVVGIQMGYCLSDIISKCGVGLVIYSITLAKSRLMVTNGIEKPLIAATSTANAPAGGYGVVG